jgi:transposase
VSLQKAQPSPDPKNAPWRPAGVHWGIRRAQQAGSTPRSWLTRLLERRATKIDAIAPANKTARIAWAMMAQGTYDHEPEAQAV